LKSTRHTFTNPLVFPIIRAYDQDQVVTCGIVGMQQICYQAQETQAPRKNDKLIFGSELVKKVLLILLV
jgi:hypothetical protein